MKYVKMLGLLAVAAAALMAFAGTASATLTSPAGTVVPNNTTLEATAGTTYLTGLWSDVECKHSQVKGTITTNDATTAGGTVDTLHFSTCNYPVTVEQRGTIHATTTAAGTATVKSFNAVVTVHTSVGKCKFATGSGGTTIGVLEGSGHNKNTTAKLNINNSKIPVTEGSFFCGSSGEWEGNYTVSTPDPLIVD